MTQPTLKERLERFARWAMRVELTTGHQGWTLVCHTVRDVYTFTHPDLDELMTYMEDEAILSGNWPVGFHDELMPDTPGAIHRRRLNAEND